jgi:hypothetical protein
MQKNVNSDAFSQSSLQIQSIKSVHLLTPQSNENIHGMVWTLNVCNIFYFF